MVQEVFEIVTCSSFKSKDVSINGYKRYSLVERVYPAIVSEDNSEVQGKLYLNVSRDSLCALCAFEDSVYRLTKLKGQCMNKSYAGESVTFVLMENHHRMLLNIPWSVSRFVEDHLEKYLEMCRTWRVKYDQIMDEK